MKKNLFAIEIAVGLILLITLLTGIILKEIVITWLTVGLIVLGGLAIVIIKIINLAQEDAKEAEKNTAESNPKSKKGILFNTKKAWQFSSSGEKIKSLLFVFTIMICCVAFIVLCSYGYIFPGLIVIGAGIGLIVVSLIVMALIDRYLLKKHLEEKETQQQELTSPNLEDVKEKEDITSSNNQENIN